jgi:hypothetical protein
MPHLDPQQSLIQTFTKQMGSPLGLELTECGEVRSASALVTFICVLLCVVF